MLRCDAVDTWSWSDVERLDKTVEVETVGRAKKIEEFVLNQDLFNELRLVITNSTK